VLLDSGIRSGADVFTAVSLGATAVLLGRPFACRLRSPESKACGR
jgi:lactate 2-monooxygenase